MKLPDSRGWVMIGLFALVFFLFAGIMLEPSLKDNQLFSNLAVAVISGSFCGGAVAFYYNTAKGSEAKDATIATMSQAISPQSDAPISLKE